MEKFYLDQYMTAVPRTSTEEKYAFPALCRLIEGEFRSEWEQPAGDQEGMLATQKKAIIGYEKEVAFFKGKIQRLLKKYGAEETAFPPWYESLADGIYHENWGLAGVAEWFSKDFRESSSAKIIGERIYFLEQGRMEQKPQKIPKERREQLVRAFLLLTPEERLDRDFHELYMLDGTRITIFRGSMVKENQDVIIFRRYIVPSYTFEEQARRRTIPNEAIPLFREMVALGYNIAFTGSMRSGKSTFLSTWQSYENQRLEGVMIETDPELPLHKIMENAPIVQLLADGDRLLTITKNLLRSDADYIIMAEARDGAALDTAVKIAGKGTRRVKITFHSRSPLDFPYDVAAEIVKSLGGDIHHTAKRVASSFDYIFHFVQLADKSQKRLKSIYEIGIENRSGDISIKPICHYRFADGSWSFFYQISDDKRQTGIEEDQVRFRHFSETLQTLAGKEEVT